MTVPSHASCNAEDPTGISRHGQMYLCTVLGADVLRAHRGTFFDCVNEVCEQLTNSFSFLEINSCVTIISTVHQDSFWPISIIFYFTFTFSF